MGTIHLATENDVRRGVRQGDVFIIAAKQAIDPSDIGTLLEEPDKSRIVLAHGEATGHAHAFYPAHDISEGVMAAKVDKPVQLFELRNSGQKYAQTTFDSVNLLRLREPSTLRHEEHEPIRFPAGDYVVIRQHEYDDMEELRRVAD